MHNPGFQARLTTFSADNQERSSCFACLARSLYIEQGKIKKSKMFFEKRGLPKREIRLNMPFFAVYGVNVV